MQILRVRPHALAYVKYFSYLCTRLKKYREQTRIEIELKSQNKRNKVMLGFSSTQEKELRLRHKSTIRKALAQRQAGVVTEEDLVLASFDNEQADVVLCR